jgi:hypothetical protein
MLRRVVLSKFTDVSDVLTASIMKAISLMMEAVRTSDMSVDLYEITRRNIPQDKLFSN